MHWISKRQNERNKTKMKKFDAFKQFLSFSFENKKLLIIALFISMSMPAIDLPFPFLMRKLFNVLTVEKTWALIVTWVGAVTAANFILNGFRGLESYFVEKYKLRVMTDLKTMVFSRLLHWRIEEVQQAGSGYLLQRINEVQMLRNSMVDLFITIFSRGALFVFGVIILFWFHKLVAVIFLICTPIFAFAMIYPQKGIRDRSTSTREGEARLSERTQEMILGAEALKSFAMEDYALESFDRFNQEVYRRTLGLNRYQVGWMTFGNLITVPFYGVSFLIIGREILGGKFLIGDLAAIIMIADFVLSSATTVGRTISSFSASLPACERVFELVNKPQAPKGTPLPALQSPKMRIENVKFVYPETDLPVLNSTKFEVEPGEWIAIAGRSGAGKTTIFRLLLGLYEPTEGRILIEDAGKTYTVSGDALRNAVAYVPQEPFILNASVIENLKLFDLSLPDSKIVDLCKDLGFHKFIEQLSKGYQTQAGEKGQGLSGGQKQMINIVRAFLKNSPFLLLDEPTSQMDPEMEKAVSDALYTLMKGRTVLIIAHKPTTLKWATRVVLIDQGRVVQTGSHNELWKSNELYRAYFKELAEEKEY
jgi:ABC-type bacteriocin/lantibiotic exporter with double-glycine peptidase domain